MNNCRKRSASDEFQLKEIKIRRVENEVRKIDEERKYVQYKRLEYKSIKRDRAYDRSRDHKRETISRNRPVYISYDIPEWKYFGSKVFRHVWSSELIPKINLNFCSGYRLRRKIGEGGFSEVFYGRRRDDDNLVVVKIFNAGRLKLIEPPHPSIRNFNNDLQEVPTEVNALIELQGVIGVVKLQEVFVSNLKDYILVFEALPDAKDLQSIIKERGSFTEYEACHYFRQIVETLNSMYKLGFHHFDIKPLNILIDRKSSKTIIIDFGGSLRVGLKHRHFIGTQSNYPPETNFGGKFYDIAFDSWCLGLLLLYMTTGNLPVTDDEKENHKRSFVMPKELSSNLQNLVNKCLSRDKDLRPNFEEILDSDWIKSFNKVDDPKTFSYSTRRLDPLPERTQCTNETTKSKDNKYHTKLCAEQQNLIAMTS